MSLDITLWLLTIFIILSLDAGFLESASAQGFNNPLSGIRNAITRSTIPAYRSLIVNLLVENL
jgi:hypothetical protein